MRINEDFIDTMNDQDTQQLLGDEVIVENDSLVDYYPVEFTVKFPKDKNVAFYINNTIRIHKVLDRMLGTVSLISSHKTVRRIFVSYGHVPSDDAIENNSGNRDETYMTSTINDYKFIWRRSKWVIADTIEDAFRYYKRFTLITFIKTNVKSLRQIKSLLLTMWKMTVNSVKFVFIRNAYATDMQIFVKGAGLDLSREIKSISVTSLTHEKWDSFTDEDGESRYLDAFRLFNGGPDKVSKRVAMRAIEEERRKESSTENVQENFRLWLKKHQNVMDFSDPKSHFIVKDGIAHITRGEHLNISDFGDFITDLESSPYKIVFDEVPYVTTRAGNIINLHGSYEFGKFTSDFKNLLRLYNEYLPNCKKFVICFVNSVQGKNNFEGKTIDLRNDFLKSLDVSVKIIDRNSYKTYIGKSKRIRDGKRVGDEIQSQWKFWIIMPDGKKVEQVQTITDVYTNRD